MSKPFLYFNFYYFQSRKDEKKIQGEAQLEVMITDQIKKGQKDECIKVIDSLQPYFSSDFHPYEKKGAFLGFNTFIKVIKKLNDESEKQNQNILDNKVIIDKLIDKFVELIKENNDDVVFYAANCLYNIIISFNSYVLNNLEIFLEALLRIKTRTEPKIIAISDDLENALKSIIIYSFQRIQKGCDLMRFFTSIIQLSSKTNQSVCKSLKVSLIIYLNQIPNFQLINILHLFIKDLFEFLEDNEVKNITKKCLDDFYKEIYDCDNLRYEIEEKLLDTIIIKINYTEEGKLKDIDNNEINFNVIKWISLFLKKSKKKYLESKEKTIKENEEQNIIKYFDYFQRILEIMLNIIKNKNENNEYFQKDEENKTGFNYYFKEITTSLKAFFESDLIKKEYKNQEKFEKIIVDSLATENEMLLNQLVEFIKIFFKYFQEDAFTKSKNFFKNFTFILTSEDEAIFAVGKDALNEMFKNKGSLKKDERIKGLILQFLTNLEKKDLDFVAKRTDEFIKLLTEKINIQTVYKSFAEELKQIKNSELVIKIINIINNQLLESNNAEMIKYQINKADKKRSNFFEILFKTWSMNSISCLLLCLIAEDFELSYELLKNFGKINLTLDDLGEYSQIIQIFESKKFTSKYKIFNSCFIYRYKIILN